MIMGKICFAPTSPANFSVVKQAVALQFSSALRPFFELRKVTAPGFAPAISEKLSIISSKNLGSGSSASRPAIISAIEMGPSFMKNRSSSTALSSFIARYLRGSRSRTTGTVRN